MFSNLKSKTAKETFILNEDKLNIFSSQTDENLVNRCQSIDSMEILNNYKSNKTRKKDDTVKEFENKVSTLICSLRERNSTIKKLEDNIQKIQIDFEKKLEKIKESSALNTQSLLDEHRIQLQEIEQEREQLKRKLLDTQNQLDAIRNECFSLSEERENINDLNRQELAKVKHLLLLRDSENEKLEAKNEELWKNLDKLEIVNKSLKFDVQKKHNDLMRLIKEREMNTEERQSQQTTIRGLLADKENIELKSSEMHDKLTKTESLLMKVERSSAGLHTKLQQCTRDLDQLKTKHSRLEEEKADRESDLKDRIRSLENHLAVVRETDQVDDRIKILEERCFQLESKCIEEKELKTDLLKLWSTRVDNLEVQIANLNIKISEDNQEIEQYNEVKVQIKEDYERKISSLKKDFSEQEKKVLSLQLENEERICLRNMEQNEWRILEDKLHSEFHKKVVECNNLMQENSVIKKDSNRVQDQHNYLLAECRSKDYMIMKLQDDVKHLQTELNEKEDVILSFTNERFRRELKLTELTSQVANLETANAELIKSAIHADSIFETIHIQINRLNEEKNALLKKLEIVGDQYYNLKRECDQRIKIMQTEVETRTSELEVSHSNLKNLQDQIEEVESENGTILVNIDHSEVLQLRMEAEMLNMKLMDRNNTIRILKQKISDLKKNLGQEIRINMSGPKSSINDNDEANNGMNCVIQQTNQSCLVSDLMSSNIDADRNNDDQGPVVIDRSGLIIMNQINFKYLKHVIVKFILSKESEAVQLMKAVSTLLRLTKDEECRVQKTLERRRNWFNISKSSLTSTVVSEHKFRLKKSNHLAK